MNEAMQAVFKMAGQALLLHQPDAIVQVREPVLGPVAMEAGPIPIRLFFRTRDGQVEGADQIQVAIAAGGGWLKGHVLVMAPKNAGTLARPAIPLSLMWEVPPGTPDGVMSALPIDWATLWEFGGDSIALEVPVYAPGLHRLRLVAGDELVDQLDLDVRLSEPVPGQDGSAATGWAVR